MKWSGVVDRDGEQLITHSDPAYAPEKFVEWGSLTKLVTARAIVSLVNRESLDYDTSAAEVLGWKLPKEVTIGNLLDHSSGLPRNHVGVGSGILTDPYMSSSREEVLSKLDESLSGYPYSHDYSNFGYAVLSEVLVAIEGKSWIEVAASLLEADFGIETASTSPPAGESVRISRRLRLGRSSWSMGSGIYAGAGGLWTKFKDLIRFSRLVSAEEKQADAWRGWREHPEFYWHNGQTKFSSCCLIVDVSRSITVLTHCISRRSFRADEKAIALYTKTLRMRDV